MTKLSSLPTLADQRAVRRATPKTTRKGAAKPVAKKARPARPDTAAAERRCREAVWRRDQDHSRASGMLVVKGHESERVRGEVAHLVSRSRSPKQKWDSANCVLLTAEEHRLSDPRTAPGGTVLLIIQGKDARKVLTFIRRDTDGTVLWTRQSAPPPKEHR